MSGSQKISYYLVLGTFRLLTLLPLKLLFLISELITFVVFHIIGYRKKVVYNNLTKSFPNYNPEKIKFIARKYYRHMSVMMVENIYLRFVSDTRFKPRLIIENKQIFDQLFEKKKNIVVMLAHFGNWEFAAGLSKLLPYKGAAVYKELSSPVFDKIYFDIRSRLGVLPIEMKEVFRKVYQLNLEQEPFMLFMVADQAPVQSENAHWINFLNQPANVFLGSEKLAKKFDLPVVYIELMRVKKGVYRVKPTLITDSPQQTKPFEITETYFSLLEQSIKNAPRYWLWSHRRWKHQPDLTSASDV